MKNLFLPLCLLCLFVADTFGTTIKVNSRNFTSEPTMRRRTTLTLLEQGPVVASPWLIAGDSVAAFTDTNGVSYFSNVLAGAYRLDISGTPGRAFPITVFDTNGIVDAAALVNTTNYNTSFYTATQTDALLVALRAAIGSSYATGTNLVTWTTNSAGQLVFNVSTQAVQVVAGETLVAKTDGVSTNLLLAGGRWVTTFSSSGGHVIVNDDGTLGAGPMTTLFAMDDELANGSIPVAASALTGTATNNTSGASGSTTNNNNGYPLGFGEWGVVDQSLNFDRLRNLKHKIETNAQVKVLVIGDSLALPAANGGGPSFGITELLSLRLGINGGQNQVGNYFNSVGTTEIYNLPYKGGTDPNAKFYDATNYFGLVTEIATDEFIEFKNSGSGFTPLADRISVNWIARPNGGTMTVSNKTSGAYSKLGDLDGFAATPTYRSTNYLVARAAYVVKVTTTATATNRVVGISTSSTNQPGLLVSVADAPGLSINNFSNCLPAMIAALTNFQPDLIVMNFADVANIGTTSYRFGLTNFMYQWATNAPNAVVLGLGLHWSIPVTDVPLENAALRDACAANNWVYFDSAYHGVSYFHQTNTSGFMADTIHLNVLGQLALGDRFWSRLSVHWPLVLPGNVLTNGQSSLTYFSNNIVVRALGGTTGNGMIVGSVHNDTSFYGVWFSDSPTANTYGGSAILGNNSITVLNAPGSSGGPFFRVNNSSRAGFDAAGNLSFSDPYTFTNMTRFFYRSGVLDAAGSGSPEGVLAAPVGSTYRRHTDGGAGTSFYVKESGTGTTGWVAK